MINKKNYSKKHVCYYFENINNNNDDNHDDILIYEKSYENILIYNASCKVQYGAEPCCNIFNKIYGYIQKSKLIEMMIDLFKQAWNIQNVPVLPKSVFNKAHNYYCCNVFLEKSSHK